MSFHARWLALITVLLLTACARTPPLADVAATLPPVPAGDVRMYFYRSFEPYESTVFSAVYLNGRRQGYSQNGAVFYRDVPAGRYRISVFSRAVVPYQFKTVTTAPGETLYVHVEPFSNWDRYGANESFVVVLADPADGAREVQDLSFVTG
jgi:hypothetical protein